MSPEQLAREYERRLSTHDPDQVLELLEPDAVFWFNDGSYVGVDAIRQALCDVWHTIREEYYEIRNLRWLASGPDVAVCVYEFRWNGMIGNEARSGWGRGTTVMSRSSGAWKITHEHLSTPQ